MNGTRMTLSDLQHWRRVIPFFIACCCVLPLFLVRPETISDSKALVSLVLTAVITAFLYVALKIRDPLWKREMDKYVGAQIRENLMTLIPEDLGITTIERQQLARSEVYRDLTGVFWETIDQSPVLRAHKIHFYSNGIEYSTAIDVFLLCSFFAFWYAMVSLFLGMFSLFPIAILWVAIALISKLVAIPRARQQHLALSAEQLDLLRRESGGFVADRFRQIVLAWRAGGAARVAAPAKPPHRIAFWKLAVAGASLLLAAGLARRGYLGPGPNVKAPAKVKSSYINSGGHNKSLVVVFVHGVFGTKDDTWVNPSSRNTFPELLATDPELKDSLDVFAFEYFSPKLGYAPSIVALSNQLRGELDDHRVFEDHQKVVFLAHSMGGIIVRQFLLNRQDRIAKVPMVFFYATPTNGSEMASIAKLASANPQFRGMIPIERNDLLQSIQTMWLSSEKARSIASYCAVEEIPTFGVMIVTLSSAASLCNREPDPFSANHVDIVKPADRTDSRYRRFITALRTEALTTESSVLDRSASLPDKRRVSFREQLGDLITKGGAVREACAGGPSEKCIGLRRNWEASVGEALMNGAPDSSYVARWRNSVSENQYGPPLLEISSEIQTLNALIGELR